MAKFAEEKIEELENKHFLDKLFNQVLMEDDEKLKYRPFDEVILAVFANATFPVLNSKGKLF